MTNKKPGKLEELKQKLSLLKNKKSVIDTEAQKWAKKRDDLNQRVKHLGAEIKNLKKQRDKLNQKVQDFKKNREESQKKIKKKIQEIKKLNQKIEPLIQKRPSQPLPTIQKKIQEKEWQLQTTSMGLEEERRIVDQVRQLAIQMEVQKKLKKLHQEKRGLQSELGNEKNQNTLLHEKLLKTAEKSQKFHQKMVKKVNEIQNLSKRADQMHQKFVESKQKVNLIREDIATVDRQINILRGEARKREREKKKKREKALRKEVGDKAREKLSRGGRLTLEEFKILVEGEEGKQD